MTRKKTLSIALATAILVSAVLIGSVSANGYVLNLPSDPVTMKVYDGIDSYFRTVLSDVPPGYDVHNGEYPGWCVDRRYTILRDYEYSVMLYSSLAPPADLVGLAWDMVNYILNHKQGAMMDVQDAIWYFIKMDGVGWWPGSTQSPTAEAIVADALANGGGFVPVSGEIVAVICYPCDDTQLSIIELCKFRYTKQFTCAGTLDPCNFPTPEISRDGLSSVVDGLHSGPRIWWQITYYFENSAGFLGNEYDGEGHYFILWDKWGGNLMALPSPPATFDVETNFLTLENGDDFYIDPATADGYKDYVGAGIELTDSRGGDAWITLHTGDQQQGTNPGQGGGSNGKDGKSYDSDIRWEIGLLAPGESAELVIYIAPGKNPGGKLQFSSRGCYIINTGPRVRVYADADYEDFLYAIDKTVQLYVYV